MNESNFAKLVAEACRYDGRKAVLTSKNLNVSYPSSLFGLKYD